MTQYGIRLPDEMAVLFSDWMLEHMPGTVVDLSLFGTSVGKATITSMKRYTDEWMGPGIWAVLETQAPEAEGTTADTSARYSAGDGP